MVVLKLALRLEHRPSPMAAESAHGADEARSLENDVFCGASRCAGALASTPLSLEHDVGIPPVMNHHAPTR
jgi:hypothetical protein